MLSLTAWGIIPARAGFTCGIISPIIWRTDHPRSRGVYYAFLRRSRSGDGSSPLARGLRFPAGTSFGGTGIIPARAGFTAACTLRSHSPEDHPRSRGVYDMMVITELQELGSSPLARGLLRKGCDGVAQNRIIPARAGFTPYLYKWDTVLRDHPRSRGVYTVMVAISRTVIGSSPLARGLPPSSTTIRGSGGIIPARAGFTCVVRASMFADRDHPRSRGVYGGR